MRIGCKKRRNTKTEPEALCLLCLVATISTIFPDAAKAGIDWMRILCEERTSLHP